MDKKICGNCKCFHYNENSDGGICGHMEGNYGGGRTHWDSTCESYNGKKVIKDRIINIVGASGTGKTTIAKELEKEGFNIIHSFTTRKPRCKDEWGHTFLENWKPVFLKRHDCKDKLIAFENKHTPKDEDYKFIHKDSMIAYFNDYDKRDCYFATKEQYQGKGTSIYIVDPDGAEQVKRNVDDAEVVTIFLNTDIEVRRSRLKGRYFKELTPYKRKETIEMNHSVINRLDKDEEIFKVVKCDYTVDANREVEEVLKDILEIINA